MRWITKNKSMLRKLAGRGLSILEIAEIMSTTYDSVSGALKRFGIRIIPKQTTTVEEPSNVVKVNKKDVGPFIADIGKKLVAELSSKKIILPEVKLKTKPMVGKEEYSILDLSDIHYGMVNKVFDSKAGRERTTYNNAIFRDELAVLEESVGQIHDLLSNTYKLKKLYINMLGDMITNDRIFQGQMFHITGCAGKQLWEIQVYLIHLINNLLRYYEEIEVNCVVGNHGRSTDTYKVDEPVENNFEYHLYRVIQIAFEKEKRVKVVVPTSYEHIVEVGPWKHLILHGDKFRGATKNYIERQVKDLIVNVGNFDHIDMGHFHFCGKTPVGENVVVKHNGCWIEKDNYAFRLFKTYSVPEQHFYGCNNKRKKTWAYEIDLRG